MELYKLIILVSSFYGFFVLTKGTKGGKNGQQKGEAMRRKLHRRDLIRIGELKEFWAIFACTKISHVSMAFWCPKCWRVHRHGWVKEPFVLVDRVAHCNNVNRWLKHDSDNRRNFKGFGGYLVFWDGTERDLSYLP